MPIYVFPSNSSDSSSSSDPASVALADELSQFARIQVNGTMYKVQVDLLASKSWISCRAVGQCDTSATVFPNDNCSTVESSNHGLVCLAPTNGTIQIGDSAFNESVVGIAQSITTEGIRSVAQGVLGLGNEDSSSVFAPETIDSRFTQMSNKIRSYSLYLSPHQDHNQSFLQLNGVDTSLIQRSNLTKYLIPFKSKCGGLALGRIHWDGHTTSRSSENQVFFDLKTKFLAAPLDDFNHLKSTQFKKCDYYDRFPRVEGLACPNDLVLPTIGFTLGSAYSGWTTFRITPAEYSEPIQGDEQRRVAVYLEGRPANSVPWLLGEKFLRKYYFSYEYGHGVTLYCPPDQCVSDAMKEEGTSWYKSAWLWSVLGCVAVLAVVFGLYRRQQRRKAERNSIQSATHDEVNLDANTEFTHTAVSSTR